VYNVKFISTKLLVEETGATLMELLNLDEAMENIRWVWDEINS
jgi:hypothetical protein